MGVKTPVLTLYTGLREDFAWLRFIIFALISQDWSLDPHALRSNVSLKSSPFSHAPASFDDVGA